MLATIIKRDGRTQQFNEVKITDAINKCLEAVGEADLRRAMELTLEVDTKLRQQYNETGFTVENVQDIVEEVLINQGMVKAAKAYILYRNERSRLREAKSEMMDEFSKILQETNLENANVGNSPSAKVLQISEVASKNYYLKRVLPEKEAKAHMDGDIYIHDLSWYGKTLTCLQIPLGRLLSEGFDNGHGHIRPPKGIKTAASLAAIILQSNMHGGQSFAYFDRDMAAYVELEKIKQEKLIRHNLEKLGLSASAYDEKIKELRACS